MKIGCIGAGYVGSTTMAVLAYKCKDCTIFVTDLMKTKIKAWNSKDIPIYEPGMEFIINKHINKNLFFTSDINYVIKNSDIIFICVNTPTKDFGIGCSKATDLSFVEECFTQILNYSENDKIIVQKSTVPVGTSENLFKISKKLNKENNFCLISSPEFLAEGSAVMDLINPNRVLLGLADGTIQKKSLFFFKSALNVLYRIYLKWVCNSKILRMDSYSSELIKLSSNAFLAQRISSINSIAIICQFLNKGDILKISYGVGCDKRIGKFFLQSSLGFGGSCFKKDILNLSFTCDFLNLNFISYYWKFVINMNFYRQKIFIKKIYDKFNWNLKNKNIVLFGFSFKEDTDDIRNSVSINISLKLIQEGCFLKIYDPKVPSDIIINSLTNRTSKVNNNSILSKVYVSNNPYFILKNSDALIISTKWNIFKQFNNNFINTTVVQVFNSYN